MRGLASKRPAVDSIRDKIKVPDEGKFDNKT
jgi:hypothetical protein